MAVEKSESHYRELAVTMGIPLRYSLIVPTVGRDERLCATLAAVFDQEATAEGFEIIIVADGKRLLPSLQKTIGKLAGPHDILWLEQPRSGPAHARNWGARHARGEWMILLDDDCRLKPDFFCQLSRTATAPNVVWGGIPQLPEQVALFSLTSHLVVEAFVECHRDKGGQYEFLPSQNLIVHRSDWERLGGFDESFRHAAGEDRNFCFRWLNSGGRLQREPRLSFLHDHPLSFREFLKKHYEYGQGSSSYFARLRGLWDDAVRPSRKLCGFLKSALHFAVRVRPRKRIPAVLLALLLSQAATLVGAVMPIHAGKSSETPVSATRRRQA